MEIAIIGLGRMGMNMARRLLGGGHKVVAYNRSREKTDSLAEEGAIPAYSLEEVTSNLTSPKAVWLMLPAGKTVDDHIAGLLDLLSAGDIIIDGGNSYYKDDIRRAEAIKPTGIQYVDAGVSGGIWGLEKGYCLMTGGPKSANDYLQPIYETLAPPDGHLHCGEVGSGHFVKMIHNGIEYGMMQAYAEGFEIMEASPFGDSLDFGDISHLWNQGSVVRSWLLELAEAAFKDDTRLDKLEAYVDDSGEGRWTVQQAVESGVPAPIITLSLFERFRSRSKNSFGNRVLAALRQQFGGHAIKEAKK